MSNEVRLTKKRSISSSMAPLVPGLAALLLTLLCSWLLKKKVSPIIIIVALFIIGILARWAQIM